MSLHINCFAHAGPTSLGYIIVPARKCQQRITRLIPGIGGGGLVAGLILSGEFIQLDQYTHLEEREVILFKHTQNSYKA